MTCRRRAILIRREGFSCVVQVDQSGEKFFLLKARSIMLINKRLSSANLAASGGEISGGSWRGEAILRVKRSPDGRRVLISAQCRSDGMFMRDSPEREYSVSEAAMQPALLVSDTVSWLRAAASISLQQCQRGYSRYAGGESAAALGVSIISLARRKEAAKIIIHPTFESAFAVILSRVAKSTVKLSSWKPGRPRRKSIEAVISISTRQKSGQRKESAS